jgi:hypothetical protein
MDLKIVYESAQSVSAVADLNNWNCKILSNDGKINKQKVSSESSF